VSRSGYYACGIDLGAAREKIRAASRHHYRMLHQEGYEITKQTNGDFVFMKPDGAWMPRALAQQFEDAIDTGETTTIERQHAALGLTIKSDTAVTLWQGEDCDDDLVLEALLAMETGSGDSAARFCI